MLLSSSILISFSSYHCDHTARVFIGGQFIGGADDVQHKQRSGELAQLLIDAGVLTE